MKGGCTHHEHHHHHQHYHQHHHHHHCLVLPCCVFKLSEPFLSFSCHNVSSTTIATTTPHVTYSCDKTIVSQHLCEQQRGQHVCGQYGGVQKGCTETKICPRQRNIRTLVNIICGRQDWWLTWRVVNIVEKMVNMHGNMFCTMAPMLEYHMGHASSLCRLCMWHHLYLPHICVRKYPKTESKDTHTYKTIHAVHKPPPPHHAHASLHICSQICSPTTRSTCCPTTIIMPHIMLDHTHYH